LKKLTSIEINSINKIIHCYKEFPNVFGRHLISVNIQPTKEKEFSYYLKNGRDLTPKFVVCGGHLISINFPPRNWEGYYAYLSRMGGKLCLLVEDGREIMPTCRCKNPLTIEE
jgi:hypothetical protein